MSYTPICIIHTHIVQITKIISRTQGIKHNEHRLGAQYL